MINDVLEENSAFGIVYCQGDDLEYAETGCSTRIVKVVRIPGGRMNILTLGERRFKSEGVIKHKPYLVARVVYFDDSATNEKCKSLSKEVLSVVDDILILSSKLADRQITMDDKIPDSPEKLSFWIAANFFKSPEDRQELLEMKSTATRLEEELLILDATKKHLAARSSLKEALG